MAFCKFKKTHHRLPKQLLSLSVMVVVAFFFIKVPHATSLTFNFPSFNMNDHSINYSANASVSTSNIDLTISKQDKHLNSSMGRITYAQPLYLWDKESMNLTDFYTNFSFTIHSLNKSDGNYGDGLAFFLAPIDFPLPDMASGGLGLTSNNETSSIPFVAVEFDTYQNKYWDPPSYHNNSNGNHVGIDISSVVSKNYVEWCSGVKENKRNNASISYNSTSKYLSVIFTNFIDGNTFEEILSDAVDLKEFLPEWVAVGFSASTGANLEIHTLHSWYFSSNLQFVDKPKHIAPMANGPTTTTQDAPKKRSKKWAGLVVGASLGAFVLLIGIIFLFLHKWHRGEKNNGVVDHFDASMDDDFRNATGPRKFVFQDLLRATSNFSEQEKLGEGGFGAVYRGFLQELNTYIAVKRVSRDSKQGMKEYASEVKVISRLRHRNLVQLIGWCHEKMELLLVYEFMPNGSLDSHLFRVDCLLTWDLRYKIAQGLASGLLYLQEEWDQCVLHRDIKSSNVMLDSNFNAKLGDFGLARLVDHGKGPETTILAGTVGYMAPECVITGKASRESDVYSFGVVALEIACGRKPINQKSSEDQHMIQWVWKLYGEGDLKEAADPRLNGDFDEQQMKCLLIVGLWCAHPDAKSRPTVKQAIQVLNFETPLPVLPSEMPDPAYLPFPPPPSSLYLSLDSKESQNRSSSHTTDSSQLTASSSASLLLMHTR